MSLFVEPALRTSRAVRRTLLAALLTIPALTAVGSTVGCKAQPTIEGTDIPDTDDNREILTVLERYRMGFVARDAAAVLATAHETYHDTGGTDDPSDDVVYESLAPMLRRRLSQLDALRFTMDYLEVYVTKDRATVHVWIDASFRFKPVLDPDGEPRDAARYSRKQDHAEFELVRDRDSWRLTSGI